MKTYETCSMPKWCNEGSHDNISPSNYYYRLDSCPLYSHDLPYIYKEKFIDKTDSNVCEDSEYGCCKYYDINCIESVEYNYGYEFYNLIKNDTTYKEVIYEDLYIAILLKEKNINPHNIKILKSFFVSPNH